MLVTSASQLIGELSVLKISSSDLPFTSLYKYNFPDRFVKDTTPLVKVLEDALSGAKHLSLNVFNDLNPRTCALTAATVLNDLEQNPNKSYLYTTRKTTNIPYKIILSPDTNQLLFLPKKNPDHDLRIQGKYKVGRPAISLKREDVDGQVRWISALVFLLSTRKDTFPAFFKKCYVFEKQIYEIPEFRGFFPNHYQSFAFPAKPSKRLSVYENIPQTLGSVLHDLHDWQIQLVAKDLIHKLCVLHNKRWVFGDLNIGNILVQKNCTVKLCDTDFSRCETDADFFGNRGSPSVRSPEWILFGSKGPFTGDRFAAEVYSLGCLLYMLHFKRPLPWVEELVTQNVTGIVEKQQNLTKANLDCKTLALKSKKQDPKLLVHLIHWMMHSDPKERPTMQEVGGVLMY